MRRKEKLPLSRKFWTAHRENWKLPPFGKYGRRSSFTSLLVRERKKKASEMNTLSPFISLAAHSVRESVVSVKVARGLSGFTVPHSYSLAFALRPTPPFLSFSSNPHQTCLTVWTQRRPLTRLQNSFICGLWRSNLDLIKQHYWSLVWHNCCDWSSPPEGSMVQLRGWFGIGNCLWVQFLCWNLLILLLTLLIHMSIDVWAISNKILSEWHDMFFISIWHI